MKIYNVIKDTTTHKYIVLDNKNNNVIATSDSSLRAFKLADKLNERIENEKNKKS